MAILMVFAVYHFTGNARPSVNNRLNCEWMLHDDPIKADSNFYVFLLIGQSNMAGRAPVPPDEKTNPDILMLNKDTMSFS